MKLLSCHIDNFGKLSGFDYPFEEDLCVLLAQNGWGKSTLAAFLRVMFYGFEGENRRSEDSNERMRYRPWQGGVYGGSVTFRCEGRTFRVHRVFGSRKKDDVFRLYDDETGLPDSTYSDLIGEEPEVPTAKALEHFVKSQDPSKPPLKGEASFAARFSPFKGELERVLVRRVPLLAAACIAAFAFILLMPQNADENLAIAYIDGKELADQTLAMQMGQEALAEIFSNGNQEQQLTELFNEP